MILNEKHERQRCAVIEKVPTARPRLLQIITIANECFVMHNFHTSAAIINGLKQPSIARLKRVCSFRSWLHI
jgi:hypothetical protein